MKNKTLLMLALLLIVFAQLNSQEITDYEATDEADFEIDRMGTIMEHLGSRDRAIIIPAQIDGTQVRAINDSVFFADRLTGVVMPVGVVIIGHRAFAENKLASVTIPDGVTSIGSRAFSDNCLPSVVIPNSVTHIGNNAFQNNVLASVTLSAGLTAINQYLFAYNRLASIAIPRSVTSIGAYAFASNYLTSVTIPDSVRSIGKGAFAENRERSYVPDQMVIYGKNLLTTITIGANVALAGGVEPSFDDGFDIFYNLSGKKAGTYILNDGRWGLE
jgi:hypothetical protein